MQMRMHTHTKPHPKKPNINTQPLITPPQPQNREVGHILGEQISVLHKVVNAMSLKHKPTEKQHLTERADNIQ